MVCWSRKPWAQVVSVFVLLLLLAGCQGISGNSSSGGGSSGSQLSPSPANLAFGNVNVTKNSSLSEKVTNTGSASVTISAANITGAGFSISGVTLPVTLAANQAATFSVKFAPTSLGAASGTLTVVSDASNSPLSVPLSGTGVNLANLTANPASLSYGNVTIGNTSNKTVTVTNAGGASGTISAANVTGAGMSVSGVTLPVTLAANQSATFTVTFKPTSSGAVSGNLAVVSDAPSSPLNVALSGTGVTPGTLTANPASQAFGSVQVGSTSNKSQTVTNTGGVAVTISQASMTSARFSLSGLTLPTTLTANQSVTFTVTFSPTSAGAVSGTLAVTSNASNSPLNVALSGTGTAPGQLSVSPATLTFGNVTVGANSALSGTLTASGASVIVSSASINSSEYALSGISLPKTITAGQSVSFTVTFTPNAVGTANASLTFASNATNAPTVESLTGAGVAPQPHSVDLSWDPSTSADVVGYNIYRQPQGGSFSKINSSLDSSTTYTDNQVLGGQTYIYAVTAVDSSGVESARSAPVQVTVPNT